MANGIAVQSTGTFTYSYAQLYPQAASLKSLVGYGSGGATTRFGATPTIIGAPTLNPYSMIATYGKGYDSTVVDTTTKTLMVLVKYPASQSIGPVPIGTYNGVNTGDTIYLNHTSSSDIFQGIGATASGGTQVLGTGLNSASTAGFTNTAAFYLLVGRWTTTTMTMSYVLNGAITNGAAATLATRYTPSANIHIGSPYASSFTSNVEIAESGIWTGVNLTDAEILKMYTYYQSIKGSSVTIG